MSDETITTFVTSNRNKLEEVIAILGPDFPLNLQNKDINLPEYQGEIDDICTKKCEDAFKLLNTPVLVEDTSLCFNALGGLPGPYVKWFLEKIGPDGLYKLLAHFHDRSGVAVCTIAYSNEFGDVKIFRGETEGTIVAPKGTKGFGWDSCFLPEGSTLTYAEMTEEMKNSISHRNKAVLKLKSYFVNNKM